MIMAGHDLYYYTLYGTLGGREEEGKRKGGEEVCLDNRTGKKNKEEGKRGKERCYVLLYYTVLNYIH